MKANYIKLTSQNFVRFRFRFSKQVRLRSSSHTASARGPYRLLAHTTLLSTTVLGRPKLSYKLHFTSLDHFVLKCAYFCFRDAMITCVGMNH